MDSFNSPRTPVDPSGPVRTHSPKTLWGVIGALAVAVAALGGTLLYQRGATSTAATATPAGQASSTPLHGPEDGTPPPMAAAAPNPASVPAPVRAPVAQPGSQPAVVGSAQPVQQAPAARPPAPVCAVCGRVESVQTVKRAAPATGVGAVAGGVVGGVLGNQIGHGGGRTAATVIGAVGGGYAGHTIEQRTRTETLYQVTVRMEDGRLRTVETRTAPPIGKAVTLKGQVLRPADGRA